MTLTLEASSSAWKRRCLRNRLRYALISVALVAVFFVAHQLLYFKQLNDSLAIARRADEQNKWKQPRHSKPIRSGNHEIPVVSLRGTRNNDLGWYLPDTRGKFHCISTGEKIAFTKVNDDYCDCPDDGSDEPGTNACNRGVFYCEAVPVETGVSGAESLMYPAKIASYKVNDGVCDCCDGSDEWDSKVHLFLGDSRQTIGLLECPDKCGDS